SSASYFVSHCECFKSSSLNRWAQAGDVHSPRIIRNPQAVAPTVPSRGNTIFVNRAIRKLRPHGQEILAPRPVAGIALNALERPTPKSFLLPIRFVNQ